MIHSINCTNGQLTLHSGQVTVKAPTGQAEIDRSEFRNLLDQLEQQSSGLTSENLTGETRGREGEEVSFTLCNRSGDPQSGSWAEMRITEQGEAPLHLQIDTWALRELRVRL